MARRLKSYQTSLGFFDLAIAAPSMKAAAEAWGSRTNLFQQGLAKETHDAAIVAATMAKPGVVLRRPVGSNGPFTEHAVLPKELPSGKTNDRPATKARPKIEEPVRKPDDKSARAAAAAFEREQKLRERARQKGRGGAGKDAQAGEQAIANAERALEKAKRHHETKVKEIESDRAALDRRSRAEDERWEKQKEKLEKALRQALSR
jgi:colicin import membrane protein